MMQLFAGIIAAQQTRDLVTSALPGAPTRLEPIGPGEHRVRRLAARALAGAADRLDSAAARASLGS
jgi:hypothetical protein